jgi:hypothetical protein
VRWLRYARHDVFIFVIAFLIITVIARHEVPWQSHFCFLFLVIASAAKQSHFVFDNRA